MFSDAALTNFILFAESPALSLAEEEAVLGLVSLTDQPRPHASEDALRKIQGFIITYPAAYILRIQRESLQVFLIHSQIIEELRCRFDADLSPASNERIRHYKKLVSALALKPKAKKLSIIPFPKHRKQFARKTFLACPNVYQASR